ncbi:efflux RND transporter periplasmic adaptor subunit [Methylogaea oryzae]|uniref:efflux RND transporter periplasmic adaptor subunit n=1 Tax=Methylogaea oryzae TaxID=1295382 RepID=UPI001C80ADB5|nr:HlyD family efflux transporter periplasmic adaptor subunit [Methylogaea oryzae]
MTDPSRPGAPVPGAADNVAPTPEQRQLLGLSNLLLLQRNARQAEDVHALAFIIVNETRQLLDYRQAALWLRRPASRIAAVSGVALLEPNAPYVAWLRQVAEHLDGQTDAAVLRPVAAGDLPQALAKDWGQWLPAHGLWVRFGTAAGDGLGGLLLCRDTPWVEGEGLLLQELAGAYEHAWHALAPPPPWWRKLVLDRDRRWLMLAIVLVFCFPVRQSVLAPAEVVAADPTVVRSPMEGVVDRFHLEPNDVVAKDQLLITLDDTDLSNRLEVSRKALAVAEAEYRRAAQQAVFDNKSRAELTILKSRMDQQAAEVAYMDDLMARSQVKAPHAGIAIFSDPHDWMGKPVAVGERLLMVADPQRVELAVQLPVADFIDLEPGAEVVMFLNVDPHHPMTARLYRASYQAETTPEDVLAYLVKARFDAGQAPPRIGLKGTAKLYGQPVTLFHYLFRRPLGAVRQWLGL